MRNGDWPDYTIIYGVIGWGSDLLSSLYEIGDLG